MHKLILLVAFLGCLLAAAPAATTPRVVPVKVGLVMIGATQEGFALAADGGSLNADGRVSQEQKLFQIGKQGALLLAGTVSIQDPVGRRVREEVNIARISGAWLAAHPDVDIQTADREINAAVATGLNKFFSTRNFASESGAFKFGIIVAGFVEGKPTVIATRYFMPGMKGKAMRTERNSAAATAGDMWIFSRSSVPLELIMEKSNRMAQFRADPAIKKVRAASPNLTLQDYVAFFDRALRASESDQGKKLDGQRAIVAPPNRFATVTPKDGFGWSTAPNSM